MRLAARVCSPSSWSAMAGQVPQLALRPALAQKLLRNKQYSQQLRNPLGVLDVGLLRPGTCFSSRGFTSNNSNDPSKMFHTGFHKTPVASMRRRASRRAAPANPTTPEDRGSWYRRYANPHPVSLCECRCDGPNRRDNRFLVQVQSCHALIDDLHDTPSYANRHLGGIGKGNNLPRVLPDHRGRQLQVRGDTQARLTLGLVAP